MRKILIIAAAAAAFSTLPAKAQVSVDMSLITCQQFMDAPHERQELIANWMRGYFSATKNLTTVDMRYVKRNTAKALGYCKRHKKDTLFKVIEKTAK
jgi:acid stress chaperone HdeB